MDKISCRAAIHGIVKAPSSKSYAQRAIAAALLSDGVTELTNMELCSDTRAALAVAVSLGAEYEYDGDTYRIRGSRGLRDNKIDIGESGLSTRMFTPIASLFEVPVTITGHGSILTRPVDMMLEPLRQLGVSAKSDGFLPLTVCGPLLGGEAWVDGSVSSQFVTGLLMALPRAVKDTTVAVSRPTSIPYIAMTIDLLASFGIEVKNNDFREFFIEAGQRYGAEQYNIEGDWSGASCILVAGAIGGEVKMLNLNPLSKQADVAIIEALSRTGAEIVTTPGSVTVRRRELNAFEFDATHCPDLFPALAALAANCEGTSVLRGTDRLKFKESDRAETLREEFSKMGIAVGIDEPNIMTVTGGCVRPADTSSHNDHRIAMAIAVAALTCDGEVRIGGAEAVDKSYPDFWADLSSIRVK